MAEDTLSLGTTISGASSGAIAYITAFGGISIDTADIETTDYDVTDKFKTFIAGNSDPGELTLTTKYVKGQFTTVYGVIGGAVENWTVTFKDSSTFVFSGYVKGVGFEFEDASDDGLVTNEVTFKLSGKPTFTAS